MSSVLVQLRRGADMIGSNLQKAVKETGEEAENAREKQLPADLMAG